MNKIITVAQKPMYDADFKRILDVPRNVVFDVLDTTRHEGSEYKKVKYRNQYIGWVQVDYTDPYHNSNKKDVVYLADIQTETPNDPEQFVLWNNTAGTKITCKNQCGEICAAAILEKPLSEVLMTWRDGGSSYAYAFNGSVDSGTGHAQLAEILKLYGVESTPLETYFGDKIHTAYRYSETLKDNQIIFGVSINQVTGDLSVKKEIAHWILLDNMSINGTNGIVDFFNPFSNEEQQASWNYLMLSAQASSNGFSGLVVPRQAKKPRSFIDWFRKI